MTASTGPERRCPHTELAVAHTLHALEPADEDLLAQHIPRCAECQDATRTAQDVVWGLAADAEQHEPPARLYTELMAAVAATDQLPPEQRERPWAVGPGRTPTRPAPVGDDRSRLAAGEPIDPAEQTRRARRRVIVLVATLVIAVIGVGAVSYEMVQRSRQLDQIGLAAPSPEVVRLLAEADQAGARHAVLRGTDGKVVAAVARFPDAARQVMPIQLPANQADHTVYVLWGLDSGVPKALGAFDVIAPSEAMLPVREPSPTGEFTTYAISIENGRAMPPSPGWIVASGKVQS